MSEQNSQYTVPPQAPQQNYAAPGGYQQPLQGTPLPPGYSPKSKIAAALLAFFLGTLGIHNFYTGRTGRAVTELIVGIIGYATSVLLIGIPILFVLEVVVFIEFILYLVGAGSYAYDAQGYPLV